MPTALVFPGQGSQRPQMAAPWRDHPGFARWAEADEVLGRDTTRLGLEADADELRAPASCQVALFVHGAVVLEGWLAAGGAEPVAAAGHSLGEYDALAAAGVLSFADGLRLVDARARHTQAAADASPGTMVACLGFDVDDVRAAAGEFGAHIANDNAPGQVVVAGARRALAALRDRLSEAGGKVISIDVGAAYHSPHMESAVQPFGEALDAAGFAEAAVPVVANVDARPHTAAAEWPHLLRAQLTAPVRWRETVGTLAGLGVTEIVELGASAVLTGMVKRIDRDLDRRTVTRPEEL
ncbi:MAG: ACP S-malonyltransferase [Euzebyales bacterium]|jgi:[acyl-carrier-protein] S-malonyltransferase|nr:ACP S-malonyltransferase [Euzebyales bacterium]